MKASLWEQISPAFYLVLGAVLSFGGTFVMEVRRDRRESSRRKHEQQHAVLLALQDSTSDLYQFAQELFGLPALVVEADAPVPTFTTEDFVRLSKQVGPVNKYRSRLKDEETRELGMMLTVQMISCLTLSDRAKFVSAVDAYQQTMLKMNERMGYLLRNEYA